MVSTASMIPMRRKKSLIELTYQVVEACGLPLWGQDEAGPYVSRPQLGTSWQLQGKAKLQPVLAIVTSVRKICLLCPMKKASCQSMCSASTINAVHFAPVF